MPVDESGTMSSWAFSRSSRLRRVVPGHGLALGDLLVKPGRARASTRAGASSQSLTAGVPQGLIAGNAPDQHGQRSGGERHPGPRDPRGMVKSPVDVARLARGIGLPGPRGRRSNRQISRGRQKRSTSTPATMLATDETMSTSSKPT